MDKRLKYLLLMLLLIFSCDVTEPSRCDDCNVCDTDTSNDNTTCIQDCVGVWGGDAYTEDENCIISDIDGNVYETVQIGEQLWMAENLKVTHYKDGSEIPTGIYILWTKLETGAYAVYPADEDEASQSTCGDDCGDVYGNLYNWYAVDDDRSICPEGFHVPSDEDFMELEFEPGNSEEVYNTPWSGFTFSPAGLRVLPAGRREGKFGIASYTMMGYAVTFGRLLSTIVPMPGTGG